MLCRLLNNKNLNKGFSDGEKQTKKTIFLFEYLNEISCAKSTNVSIFWSNKW